MKILTIEEEAANLKARFQGVNRAEFARDHHLKGGQSMIYQNITGRRPISMEAAKAYAKGFGCTLEDISPRLAAEAAGAAKHLAPLIDPATDERTPALPDGFRRLPLLTPAQANMVFTSDAPSLKAFTGEHVTTDMDVGPLSFGMVIAGDEMLPHFRAGDRIIIDPDVEPLPGDFVVAQTRGSEAIFRKYQLRPVSEDTGREYDLAPLNTDYPTLNSKAFNLHIVGTMVEHRQYRRR